MAFKLWVPHSHAELTKIATLFLRLWPFYCIELEKLRTLRLNSSKAFDTSPVRVPDRAFTELVHFDLASTAIDSADMISILPIIKYVEKLNLTSCAGVNTEALEQIVQSE